jgi:hypothetical protein
MTARDAFDYTVETETTKLVSHSALGQFIGLQAEQRSQILSEIAIGKSGGKKLEQQQRAAQRLNLRIGEAERGSPLRVDSKRAIQFLKYILDSRQSWLICSTWSKRRLAWKAMFPKAGKLRMKS